MNWFKMIDGWYNREVKLWTIDMVADAVVAKKITEEEFFKITKVTYKDYLLNKEA